MRPIICLTVLLGLAGSVLGADWTAVVVKAKSYKKDDDGGVTVQLLSGEVLQLTAADWSPGWSEGVDTGIANQEKEQAAQSTLELPDNDTVAPGIRRRCTEKWEDDFKMIKYCEDQQFDALRKLRKRTMTGQFATIRTKCAEKWDDDYKMRDYCETQQIKAYKELSR